MTGDSKAPGLGRDPDRAETTSRRPDAVLGDLQTLSVMIRREVDAASVGAELLAALRCLAGGLRLAEVTPAPGGSHHDVLANAPGWRVGVLTLGPDARIPLHDHPGSYALGVGLLGSVEIRIFALLGDAARGMARLKPREIRTIGRGDAALLDPDSVNLHALRAGSEGCRLLTGRFATGAGLEPSRIYFPGPTSVDGCLSAVVVDRTRGRALAEVLRSAHGPDSGPGVLD